MDEINSVRNTKIFNTPLEAGLRVLILLNAANGRIFDLQQLVFLDYLVTHSSDVAGGPESLHADIPHRLSAISVRRNLTATGLDLMLSRELVLKKYDPVKGVLYEASQLTSKFLSYFNTLYFKSLNDRAIWVITTFGNFADDELKKLFNNNFDRWNSEFSKEAFERPT